MYSVDLHLHTTASDGRWLPAELARRAADAGVDVMSVTDHDTIAGVADAQSAGKKLEIEVVPGVEISVTCNGQAIHLLGYFFRLDDAPLNQYLSGMKIAREQRARLMVERLKLLGAEVTYDQVLQNAAGGIIGRPHIAEALVDSGVVETEQEAFEQFISNGGPAYVAKPERPAAHALQLLHDAGGIGVLAHPGHWTHLKTIEVLVDAGLDGIEVSHPSHDRGLTRYYERKAAHFGLVPSGGSDAHGRLNEETQIGSYGLSMKRFERLRELAE